MCKYLYNYTVSKKKIQNFETNEMFCFKEESQFANMTQKFLGITVTSGRTHRIVSYNGHCQDLEEGELTTSDAEELDNNRSHANNFETSKKMNSMAKVHPNRLSEHKNRNQSQSRSRSRSYSRSRSRSRGRKSRRPNNHSTRNNGSNSQQKMKGSNKKQDYSANRKYKSMTESNEGSQKRTKLGQKMSRDNNKELSYHEVIRKIGQQKKSYNVSNLSDVMHIRSGTARNYLFSHLDLNSLSVEALVSRIDSIQQELLEQTKVSLSQTNGRPCVTTEMELKTLLFLYKELLYNKRLLLSSTNIYPDNTVTTVITTNIITNDGNGLFLDSTIRNKLYGFNAHNCDLERLDECIEYCYDQVSRLTSANSGSWQSLHKHNQGNAIDNHDYSHNNGRDHNHSRTYYHNDNANDNDHNNDNDHGKMGFPYIKSICGINMGHSEHYIIKQLNERRKQEREKSLSQSEKKHIRKQENTEEVIIDTIKDTSVSSSHNDSPHSPPKLMTDSDINMYDVSMTHIATKNNETNEVMDRVLEPVLSTLIATTAAVNESTNKENETTSRYSTPMSPPRVFSTSPTPLTMTATGSNLSFSQLRTQSEIIEPSLSQLKINGSPSSTTDQTNQEKKQGETNPITIISGNIDNSVDAQALAAVISKENNDNHNVITNFNSNINANANANTNINVNINTNANINVNASSNVDSTKSNRSMVPYTGKCRMLREHYHILNDIHEGTYGRVKRAECIATGEQKAVKVVKISSETTHSGFPKSGLREMSILMSLQHENVVKLEEIVLDNRIDRVGMILEFCEQDLHAFMKVMLEGFNTSELKCLMKQLLEGVAYLHKNWVIHRDLKTANLLLNNGTLKICDFGMARRFTELSLFLSFTILFGLLFFLLLAIVNNCAVIVTCFLLIVVIPLSSILFFFFFKHQTKKGAF
ncbi:hypothetical protein RFI_09438 [Reticulomyxa filosa]|uniref:Cyclin-dependent kinase 2 homolog n=1 Tax=Reticulomyxa filosa TaxID=46433 RepID=X6NQQ5_RETFI|nr:hypothetical protein RFI_09438 [Reticulomyxa filosa]|eukprot:ETO27692.1 hypothetical protein RFI_09438 [Reticulomyxa filosa]